MFGTTRRSSLNIRILLNNDKTIGKLFNMQNFNGNKTIIKRNYVVKQTEWDSYGKDIVKTYMSTTLQNQNKSTLNYSINDALMDTISIQTEDIKYIKLELISLNAKMKKIIDYNENKLSIKTQKNGVSHPKC
jgi:hypothetical protein